MRNLFSIFLLAGLLVACGPAANGGSGHGEDPDWLEVTVVSSTGEHTFHVDIADDAAEQRRGLMYRREMAADAGMLFLYDEEEPLSYWMRNTYIPLDIIYIDQTGRIVSIARDTTPLSERSIPSAGPAIAVLEVNAGISDEFGFVDGDQVRHPFFGN